MMPRPKKMEIHRKNRETVKEPGKKISQTQCHEIGPNPWKDRAMHEGHNP
jgi:hypothetical protein